MDSLTQMNIRKICSSKILDQVKKSVCGMRPPKNAEKLEKCRGTCAKCIPIDRDFNDQVMTVFLQRSHCTAAVKRLICSGCQCNSRLAPAMSATIDTVVSAGEFLLCEVWKGFYEELSRPL